MTDYASSAFGEGEILPRRSLAKRPAGGSDWRASSGEWSGPSDSAVTGDVGAFRQGNEATHWALSHYLVGRVVVSRVQLGLLFTALMIVGLAALAYMAGITWLAVLISLGALGVLIIRWMVVTVVGRLIQVPGLAAYEDRLRSLVGDTSGDLRREMRRAGVPFSWYSFPILMFRLMRRGSRRTLIARMRTVDLDSVVPASRVDELHILIDSVRRSA